MRVLSVLLLLLSIFACIHCQDDEGESGSEDNPYPEGEGGDEGEADEDATDAPEEGEDAVSTGKEGEGLEHYEDTGAGEALTQDHLRKLHGKLDKDKDGKVALHEVLHYAEGARKKIVAKEIAGIFDEIDSTKDGHLSLEEHLSETAEFLEGTDEEKALQKAHDMAKFKAADMNGDDLLDKHELVSLMHPDTHPEVLDVHTKEEMRKKDTDKDGKLSKSEWEAGDPAHPDGHDLAKDVDHFENLDEDKDGSISLTELQHWESGKFHTVDAMTKLIKLADKDNDGQLTKEELAQVAEHIVDHDSHHHLSDWVFHADDDEL